LLIRRLMHASLQPAAETSKYGQMAYTLQERAHMPCAPAVKALFLILWNRRYGRGARHVRPFLAGIYVFIFRHRNSKKFRRAGLRWKSRR